MMQSGRSCTVREITLDREYRVAPPERWDTETRPRSRKPPQSRRARRRRSSLLPFAVLGLAIFLCGFFFVLAHFVHEFLRRPWNRTT